MGNASKFGRGSLHEREFLLVKRAKVFVSKIYFLGILKRAFTKKNYYIAAHSGNESAINIENHSFKIFFLFGNALICFIDAG